MLRPEEVVLVFHSLSEAGSRFSGWLSCSLEVDVSAVLFSCEVVREGQLKAR